MSCRPPINNTYLVIGQDLFSINEYVTSQYNYSLHQSINSTTDGGASSNGMTVSDFVPSAYMVYTDLQTLNGLGSPTDYGSGVEYADGVLNLFPSTSGHGTQVSTGIQIGLWLNGTQGCFSIMSGDMDGQIEQLTSYLERTRATKVFLRLGYEFDNPSFGYSDDPAMYILAFRKLVKDCREQLSKEAMARVLFIWHSWAAPMASEELTLDAFYPGDEYVDWIGVSIFQQVFPWSPPGYGGTMSDVENVLEFAKKHDKPTIIAESTPFGGIELKQASNETNLYLSSNEYNHDEWDRWFGKVMDVIDKYDVDMFCYINCDWESQPMWHNVGFGETRLSSNDNVMKKWHELVINGVPNRKFLGSGSLDNCGMNIGTENLGPSAETNQRSTFGLTHFYSFILVPFLVASGAFFVPYFILGGFKARDGHGSSKERTPLLSNMDASTSQTTQSVSKKPPVDGLSQC